MRDFSRGEVHMKKKLLGVLGAVCFTAVLFSGCKIAFFENRLNDIKGQLIGNSFDCYFYDNNGEKFLTASGEKIGLTSNIVETYTVTEDGSYETNYELSSVITISIDGDEIQSCGDTVIFEEEGLEPDVDFELQDIHSSTNGSLADNTSVSRVVNDYKNYFGEGQVVLIQSQLGVPICAYSGEDVYWEIREDLPKTTKLMIDGKALYIHRANFQIIDTDLIQ